MKGFLIACSLFVFCYAADRPVIPDTFDAKTKFELHRGREAEFGTGYWCSDSASQAMVRNDTLEKAGSGYFYDLELFKEHKDYHIRPDEGREECNNEPLRGDFMPPFDWIKQAKYNGSETIEHHTLDVWFFRAATTELAVGVEADAPNVPVVFMERSHGMEMFVEFTSFVAKTPPASEFDVPRQCRE